MAAVKDTRIHTCHWPGCTPHWFALPKQLRDKIWATYRPGQEISMSPSKAYLDAAHEVQQWIKRHS